MKPENQERWHGKENTFVRYYFYCLKGMNILNEFRNLFFILIGAYFSLKLTNPWILVAAFFPSILLLCIVGWYAVHRMGKTMEWLNIKFSTHFGMLQITLLEEIRDSLKKIEDKNAKGNS